MALVYLRVVCGCVCGWVGCVGVGVLNVGWVYLCNGEGVFVSWTFVFGYWVGAVVSKLGVFVC